MNSKIKIISHLLVISLTFLSYAQEENLDKGRNLFYKSVENEEHLQDALDLFSQMENIPKLKGKATVYKGALKALEGKHSFWPRQKYNKTLDGLAVMEQGLEISPNDVESLFIYAMTTHYLPFFFHKKEASIESMKKIINLAETSLPNIEPTILKNALEFIITNGDISKEDKKVAHQLIEKFE